MRGSAAVFSVSATSYIAMVLGAVRGILVMRIIGPTGRGIMQSVNLFMNYLSHAHIGILDGVSKQLPLAAGSGDYEEADEIESVGMVWVIGLTAIAGLGMVVWGLSQPTGQRTTGIAIIIGGGWLLAQQTFVLYKCIIRSWGNFRLLAWVTLADGIFAFGLTVLGAVYWGVLGAMGGLLVAWLLDLGIMHFFSGVRIRPVIKPKFALYLLKIGLWILLIKFSDIFMRSIEGAIIIRYYDAYRFGLYSVGMQMARYMFTLPEAAGFVIWPKIMEKWGGSEDVEDMRRHVEIPTITSGTVMPFLSGLATIALPALVMLLIPKFEESIPAAIMLLWGGVFLALPLATNSLLVARNREWVVVIIRTVAGAALGVAAYWLVSQNAALVYIAVAAAAAYALASILSLAVVLPHYFSGRRLLGEFAVCYVPTLWAVACMFITDRIAASFIAGPPDDVIYALVRIGFFVALYGPVLLYTNYRVDLWKELKLSLSLRGAESTPADTETGDADDDTEN